MDHKFTEPIKKWLETPEAERDYTVGALYLLKLSGNQIMYRNIVAQLENPERTDPVRQVLIDPVKLF